MKLSQPQNQLKDTAQIEADVRVAVDNLLNLDADQAKRVFDIARAFALKTHLVLGYENIANLVRTSKPTPTGHNAFPKGAW